MSKQIKKYVSFFFLLLFLFPTAETQLHAFEHAADVHCHASDKHFHPLEHHCSICDFTATDSNIVTDEILSFSIPGQRFLFVPLRAGIHKPATFQDLPSRAPPLT